MEEVKPHLYVLFYQAWDDAQATELQGMFEVVDAAEEMPGCGYDVGRLVQAANDGVHLSLCEEVPFSRSWYRSCVQAVYFWLGREIMRLRVLYLHPRITLTSSMAPSAVILEVEMGFDRGVGSWVESGRQKVCITSGMTAAIRDELPERYGVMAMVALM